MNKNINPIILDFDYTLFDCTKFKVETINNLASLGVTTGIYQQTYMQIRKELQDEYLPINHCKQMSKVIKIGYKKILNKYQEVIDSSQKYLYIDSLTYLKECTKQKIPLYLITFGNPIFQKQKIDASGISHYFKQIICTNKSKHQIITKIPNADNALFINDNPYEILELQKLLPNAKFIQISRENGKKFDLKLDDIIIRHDLK